MSFSSTPLGQGRRLDHSTFLGKNLHQHKSAPKIITSPPRSPEKLHNTTVNVASAFQQAALQSEAMNPNDSWASGASASYRNVPRSTSVDYEKETQNTSARRLAAPPRRNALPPRATKPLSKSGSINSNIVPDSQLDEEPSQLENRSYQRGKSPVVDAINGVYQKVSFYMRARSNEPDNSLDHSGNGPQEDASYSYDQEEQQFQASQPANARKLNSHRRRNISVDNKAYKPSQSDLEQSDSDFEDDGRKRRKKAKKGGPHGGPLNSLPVTQYDKRKRRKSKGSKGGAEGEGEGSAGEEMDDEASQSNSSHRTSQPPRAAEEDSIDYAEQGLKSIPEDEEDDDPQEANSTDVPKSPSTDPVSPQSQSPQAHSRSKTPQPRQARPSSTFSIGALCGRGVNRLIHYAHSIFFLGGQILGLIVRALLTNGPIRYVSLGLALCAVWYILGSPSTSLQHYILGWGTSSVASPPTAPPADFAEISARLQAIESTVFALSTSQDRVRVDLVSEIKSRDSLNDEIKKVFGDVGRVNSEVGKLKSQIGTIDGRLGTVDGSVGKLSAQIGSLGGDLSKLGRQIGSLSGQISTLEGRVEAGGNKGKDGVSVDSGALANLKKEIGSVSERLVAFSSIVDRLDGLRREWESERSKKDREKEKTGNESRVRLQTLEDRMDTIAKSVDEALDLGRQSHGETKPWWASLPGKKTDSSIVIKTTDGQDISSLLSDLVSSTVIGYFAKDILGKPDYALYSGGARVIPSLTSPTYEIKPSTLRGSVVGMLTGQGYALGRPPVTGLHPETHNGHCWPFAGTHGQLGVALGAPVFVNEIAIEHVPGDVAFDLRSAPRDMEVWGVVEGMDNLKRLVAWREEQRHLKESEGEQQEQEPYPPTLPSHPPYIRLAKFSYDVRARNHIQVFPVLPEIKALGIDFGVVVLMVKNNWGMDDYTCIYRMRVHGDRLGEVPPLYDSRLPESSES